MRDWVSSLEAAIDKKLAHKWKKEDKHENGESVHMCWQFEQTHFRLTVFWEDTKELVRLTCEGPRDEHKFTIHGLNNKTWNRVIDRVGNLAQVIQHPPIDPTD